MDLASLIAQFEGYGTPGTIATRQNNPGDIVYGPFAQSQGATGAGARGIAIFPTPEAGFTAENQLIQNIAGSGASIRDMIMQWAPPNAPGNTPAGTDAYVNFVSKGVGSTPDTKVSSILGGSGVGGGSADTSKNPTLGDYLGSIFGTGSYDAYGRVQDKVTPAAQSADQFLGLNLGRAAAFLIGIITIGIGLLMFRPVADAAATVAPGQVGVAVKGFRRGYHGV
jgi:hypothetical protein